jgi:hypothetical protein
MITIKLIDSVSKITTDINLSIAQYLNDRIIKNRLSTINKIKSYIPAWINSQPEIISLQSQTTNTLFALFGLRSGSTNSIVEDITNSVVNSLSLSFTPIDNQLNGGITIELQPADFQNLLSLQSGHVVYSQGDLHWLNWLLTMGNSVIIANYNYSPQSGAGRSRQGIMKFGGSFRVPPQYSGTDTDNFITRALTGSTQEDQITQIINTELFK